MFSYINSAAEWLQRKALQYVLRAKLGEFFEDDCDLAQLEVQFRQHEQHGDLTWRGALSDVRINTAALAKHLAVPGWRVASARARKVELSVRIAALSCSVHLDGVDVSVHPVDGAPPEAEQHTTPPEAGGDARDGAGARHVSAVLSDDVPAELEGEGASLLPAAFQDQIMGIAAALEKLLNTMSVRLDDVRVEVSLAPPPASSPLPRPDSTAAPPPTTAPPGDPPALAARRGDGDGPGGVAPSDDALDDAVVCRLGSVRFFDSTFADGGGDGAAAHVATRNKTVSVTGLVVEVLRRRGRRSAAECVEPAGSPPLSSVLLTGGAAQGYNLTAQVEVQWSQGAAAQRLAAISVSVSSRSCLCVPLQPGHLPVLERLVTLTRPDPAAPGAPPGASAAADGFGAASVRLGDSSFFDGLLRPATVWEELAAVSAAAAFEAEGLPPPAEATLAESFYNASSQMLQSMMQPARAPASPGGAPPPLAWSVSIELGSQLSRAGGKQPGKAVSVCVWSRDAATGDGAQTPFLQGGGACNGAAGGAALLEPWCVAAEVSAFKLDAKRDDRLTATCSFTGLQVVESLPQAVSDRQGGRAAIYLAGLAPGLVQMAPKSPAADSCASMYMSDARARQQQFCLPCPVAGAVQGAPAPRLQDDGAYATWPLLVALDRQEEAGLAVHAQYKQVSQAWPAAPRDSVDVAIHPFAVLLTLPLLTRTLALLEACSAALHPGGPPPPAAAAAPLHPAPGRRPAAAPPQHSAWPGRSSHYASGLWSVDVLANSTLREPAETKWTAAVLRVSCTRLCLIALDSSAGAAAAPPAACAPTIVIVDVRSLPAQRGGGGKLEPLAQATRTACSRAGAPAPRSDGATLQVALGSVNTYMVQVKNDGADSLNATCFMCMRPRSDGASGATSGGSTAIGDGTTPPPLSGVPNFAAVAPRCALWLDMELHSGGRGGRDFVMGDAVGLAWAQTERHTRRDWQTSAPPKRPSSGAARPPAGGEEGSWGGSMDSGEEHVDAAWFDAQFDELTVKEACLAGCTAYVRGRAPSIKVHVDEGQLARVSEIAAQVGQVLRPVAKDDAACRVSAPHVVVQLQTSCGAVLSREGVLYRVDVGAADLFACQGLAGTLGAGLSVITATDVKLTCARPRPNDEVVNELLLHVPPSAVQGHRVIEIVTATRPDPTRVSAGSLFTHALTSVLMRGATFGTRDGDISLRCHVDLVGLLRPAPPRAAPDAPPPLPSAVVAAQTSLSVSLEECALAYAPGDAHAGASAADAGPGAACMVAYARGLHWLPAGTAHHVQLFALRVAVGPALGGAPPWRAAAPAAGWNEATCAAMGLVQVFSDDVVDILYDAAADAAPPPPPPPAAGAHAAEAPPRDAGGVRLEQHGPAKASRRGGGGVGPPSLDPLEEYMKLRRRGGAAPADGAAASLSNSNSSVSLKNGGGWRPNRAEPASTASSGCLFESALPGGRGDSALLGRSFCSLEPPPGAASRVDADAHGLPPSFEPHARLRDLPLDHSFMSVAADARALDQSSLSVCQSEDAWGSALEQSFVSVAASCHAPSAAGASAAFAGVDEQPARGLRSPLGLSTLAESRVFASPRERDRCGHNNNSLHAAALRSEPLAGSAQLRSCGSTPALDASPRRAAHRHTGSASEGVFSPRGGDARPGGLPRRPSAHGSPGRRALGASGASSLSAGGLGDTHFLDGSELAVTQHTRVRLHHALVTLRPESAALAKQLAAQLAAPPAAPEAASSPGAPATAADADERGAAPGASDDEVDSLEGESLSEELADACSCRRASAAGDATCACERCAQQRFADGGAGASLPAAGARIPWTALPDGGVGPPATMVEPRCASPPREALDAATSLYADAASVLLQSCRASGDCGDGPSRRSTRCPSDAAFAGGRLHASGPPGSMYADACSALASGSLAGGSFAAREGQSGAGLSGSPEADSIMREVRDGEMSMIAIARECPTVQEADGAWFGGAGPPEVQDAYVAEPDRTEAEVSVLEAICGPLRPHYPHSLSRLALLADQLCVTILPSRVVTQGRQAGQLRLELQGLRLQRDVFAPTAEVRQRVAGAVAHFAVTQSGFGPRPARAPPGGATGGVAAPGWRPVVSLLQNVPRDARADMVRVFFNTVAPRAEGGPEEVCASVTLSSLRLRLDQQALLFLRDFAAVQQTSAPVIEAPPLREDDVLALDESEDSDTLLVSLASAAAGSGGVGHSTIFRRFDVAAFTIAVDYKPSKADYAALCEGSLVELANLINWDNVHVHFKRATLRDVSGASKLAATLAADWVADIRAHQTTRLLEGATPVAGFVRVGSAAAKLAADLAALPPPPKGGAARGGDGAPPAPDRAALRRSAQRSLVRLLQTVALEALGLGAWLAGGTGALLGADSSEVGGTAFTESADRITRAVGRSLAALVVDPVNAIRRGQAVSQAARMAIKAVPTALAAPAAAAASAVQHTCVALQHVVDPAYRTDGSLT